MKNPIDRLNYVRCVERITESRATYHFRRELRDQVFRQLFSRHLAPLDVKITILQTEHTLRLMDYGRDTRAQGASSSVTVARELACGSLPDDVLHPDCSKSFGGSLSPTGFALGNVFDCSLTKRLRLTAACSSFSLSLIRANLKSTAYAKKRVPIKRKLSVACRHLLQSRITWNSSFHSFGLRLQYGASRFVL